MATPLFSIKRESLKIALTAVLPTIKGGSGSEILSCVLINADSTQGAISFTTTRVETTTQYLIVDDCPVTRNCTLALPARQLSDLIDQMTGDTIDFIPSEHEDWWEIQYAVPGTKKPGLLKIVGLNPENFPNTQIQSLIPLNTFGAEQFGGYLKQAHGMMSKGGTYAPLESLCLILPENGEVATLYGADNTHGIARIYVPILEKFDGYTGKTYLLPQKSVTVLMHAKPSTDVITFMASKSGTQVGFRFGATTISSSLLFDSYPPVEKLFRESSAYQVTISRPALERVASMAQTLYADEAKAIMLSLGDGLLNVCSYKTERGSVDQDISAEVIGGEGFIQISPSYLIDSLSGLGTKEVILDIESQAHAMTIRSDEKPNCVHMLFPMHGNVKGKAVSQ
jgi:DNA polymerase III sliding clamp (beta) subunit (PCNA family)